MRNFNLNYDLSEVYSNFEDSSLEYKDKSILPEPDTTLLIAVSNTLVLNIVILRTNNELITSSVCSAVYQDFDSLCYPYVASSQICVVIRNRLMTIGEEKLDKVYIDLCEPNYPGFLADKTYMAICLDEKIRKTWLIYLQSKDEFAYIF